MSKKAPKRELLGHCFLCEQPVWRGEGGELRSFDNRPQHYECDRIDAARTKSERMAAEQKRRAGE